MKVFATNFLERPQEETVSNPTKWNWEPYNKEIEKIYASGSKTATRQSTYAAEKDNESDSDRPNEGA
ncbi:hypothetical protein [Flavobacterium aestivum]|uniref:hypothetical protein n=1 Tax=Flavobacterium aestivum TaxID=3003257 RepID=UPI002285D5D2|nr:hypothetical protein [Flavobacterium aestivum]